MASAQDPIAEGKVVYVNDQGTNCCPLVIRHFYRARVVVNISTEGGW